MLNKIAIVEDDAAVRDYMVSTMKSLGYDAVAFVDGQEALKALKEDSSFDTVITDILMPVMTGRQLVEEMKNDSNLKSKAVIIYSGAYEQSDVNDLMDDRTYFIKKPFNLVDLESLLTKLDLGL